MYDNIEYGRFNLGANNSPSYLIKRVSKHKPRYTTNCQIIIQFKFIKFNGKRKPIHKIVIGTSKKFSKDTEFSKFERSAYIVACQIIEFSPDDYEILDYAYIWYRPRKPVSTYRNQQYAEDKYTEWYNKWKY